MKANITLKLDQDLLRQARLLAAEENSSVSQLLANHLEQLIRQRGQFKAARRRALALLRSGLELHWKPGSRDALHER